MKKTICKVIHILHQSALLTKALGHMLYYRVSTNHIKCRYSGKLTLLANGPSLKDVLPRLNFSEFADTDFVVLNFFAESKEFWEIHPKHYCLADPMFFQRNHRYEKVKNLFEFLEKVDWEMNIYIPSTLRKEFIHFSRIRNPHLKIIPVHVTPCDKLEASLRNYFYKKGWSCPAITTVAILALYIGINSGYSHIDLYGVDHTFFDSMCINDENQLCNRETHFYDDETPQLKPIIRNHDDKIWRISDYVHSIGGMFASHDLISDYAHYMNVEIINCTPCSMIDSYTRRSQRSRR